MKLSLIITQNCSACIRAEAALRDIAMRYPNVYYNIIDEKEYKGTGISILPALIIDDELFSYGDIDESNLLSSISKKQEKLKAIE